MVLYCTSLLHTCLSTALSLLPFLLSFHPAGLLLPVVSPLLLASLLHVPLLADCCVHPPLLPPPAAVTKKSLCCRSPVVNASCPPSHSSCLPSHPFVVPAGCCITCCLCCWHLCHCCAHANALVALASLPLLRWHLCHHCH